YRRLVNHRFRRPDLTEPRQKFTCIHPSDLPLARLARMVRVCLGHHPSAFARFVTWRLRGSGTGMDTSRDGATSHIHSSWSNIALRQTKSIIPALPRPQETRGPFRL